MEKQLEGEDHLLTINPETRAPAKLIRDCETGGSLFRGKRRKEI